MGRNRTLIASALVVASALLIAACGGGGGDDEDAQQVLQQTFSNPTTIRSGTFDLLVKLETSGGDNPGSFEAKLGGKFASQGANQFPKFDVDASVKALTSILEPIMIVVIGGIVGFIVVSMYLPLFTVYNNIK